MELDPKPRKEVDRHTARSIRFYSTQPLELPNRRIQEFKWKVPLETFVRRGGTVLTAVCPLMLLFRVCSLGVLLLLLLPASAQNLPLSGGDPNHVIVSVLKSMPIGGGYLATDAATRDLQSAVQVRGGKLQVNPSAARTTYCSGATYLVFIRAIQLLVPESTLAGGLAEALAIKGQPDGVGIWGRWNANGPGTACLFNELGLGRNFTSFEAARPGDFMKIFWTKAVGRREHGHSVIYLGREQQNGVEMIRFWSSNKPLGYGEKSVPRSRIAFAIFSRLETPQNIARSVSLPSRNGYLSGLLATESSVSQALGESGTER